jgi:CheY-like chemotaxis protein
MTFRSRIADSVRPGFAIVGDVHNCGEMAVGTLHILLVEDDPAVAGMYKLKLEMDGYRVSVAGDGEEGLRIAREHKPQLIFLDVRLPKMDGMSVLEAMRGDDRTRHIPVLILSNYAEPPLIERGLSLGAREYLVKSETTPSSVSARARTYTTAEADKTAGDPKPA